MSKKPRTPKPPAAPPAPAPSPFTPPPVVVLNFPPPTIPQITETPLPPDQQAALLEAWNPFSTVQHEATMNRALMNQTRFANANKITAYMLAYGDWKTNAELYLACRPPITPPLPPPPPALENVGPMPTGYWFGTH